ncbi:MAG: hypothetical protein GFH27_549395n60 [Chloroflexi bacterium AL-W]|nr:hypothetical protein [Chloroflexi bacterium AL-W]
MQKRDKERVNVYLDGEYAFSLALIEAAKLRKGQQLTEDDIIALRADDAVSRAVDHAARFLSYRPRSTREIRDNLHKRFDDTVIDTAMSKLEALGYLDDHAFARYWVENRDTFKPRGTTALRYELRQKGLSNHIIEETLSAYDNNDAAYRAAEAKARRLRGLDVMTFRRKMGSFLQRRGFNFDVIRDVLQQLENELVAQDDQFFRPDDGESDN